MEEKLSRPEVREGAFLILFQTLFGATPEETDEIVRGVTEHDKELTEIIAKYSKTRSVARIAKVNMVILKIAVYEMKYCDRVPCAAAINEAVELAKKYSMKPDSAFINGVLSSYMGELNGKQD